ncbi:YkgJ family cysteine cluster protein [Stutzerimonas nitrititolerans]|uniref:YkgJ family cysteine cluster protein n=1 Tax=Stutzerimonas nitrititolerans TaxID=2482751 RepID=UPI0035E41CA0
MLARTFPCNKCGICCQKVHLAPETRFLDRGDGTCRHYDATSKGCNIYTQRPDICRVDRQYELIYSQRYSWDEFVAVNVEICLNLQTGDLIKA